MGFFYMKKFNLSYLALGLSDLLMTVWYWDLGRPLQKSAWVVVIRKISVFKEVVCQLMFVYVHWSSIPG